MGSTADIHLASCHYGGCPRFEREFEHVKTVPVTIVAQCLSGCYEVWCEGQHERIAPGELFVVGAMQQVRIGHHFNAEGHMSARWVHMSVERFARVDALAAYRLPLAVRSLAAQRIGRALDGLAAIAADDGSLSWQVGWRHHSWAIVDELMQLAELRDDVGDLIGFEPVFRMVDRGIGEQLSVSDMAAVMHLSEPRFHVVFKQAMGCTPKAWLQQQRLQRAAHELLHSDDSIQQVAARCGFQSPFHFSRAFKAWCGSSPRSWRCAHHDLVV